MTLRAGSGFGAVPAAAKQYGQARLQRRRDFQKRGTGDLPVRFAESAVERDSLLQYPHNIREAGPAVWGGWCERRISAPDHGIEYPVNVAALFQMHIPAIRHPIRRNHFQTRPDTGFRSGTAPVGQIRHCRLSTLVRPKMKTPHFLPAVMPRIVRLTSPKA